MARKKRPEGTRAPNGASTVYQGEDGKWHGRVTMGVRDDGKPDRRHVERKTEAEAIKAVRELERARDSGKVRKPGRVETVAQWLLHWLEFIAAPSVRPTTMVGYQSSVYNHLVPGVGAHRLDKLKPEHLERLYENLIAPKPKGKGLKPATAHLAHRTVRVALNEAVRRGRIVENPAKVAKPPRVEEDEIVPFSVAEAQRLFDAAAKMRNGARYVVAIALGLRRGEALGLRWSDIKIKWEHGCLKGSACRKLRKPMSCPKRRGSGTLTVRRAIQQLVWKHGCPTDRRCGELHARKCLHRHGGGIVVGEVKSQAGRRVVGLPGPVVDAIEAHRVRQAKEREKAADLWREDDWVFTNRLGGPVHPTEDYRAWKSLLGGAKVRNARLHDARHTAATMLLVLKVPLPAVMELMGWSDASIAKRYMHVPEEVVASIAAEVGELMWARPDQSEEEDVPVLTPEQRDAVRRLAGALPERWAQHLAELLPDDDGDDGPAGALISA